MRIVWLLCTLHLLDLCTALSPNIVPLSRTPQGIYYQGDGNSQHTLEYFLDPLCWFSSLQWPVIKQLGALHRPEQLAIKVQIYAQPFHTWGYTASVGVMACRAAHPETKAWVNFLEAMFHDVNKMADSKFCPSGNIGDNYSPMTSSEKDLIDAMADVGVTACNMTKKDFMHAMTYRQEEGTAPYAQAREAWKYGATHGIASMPFALVNSVPVFEACHSVWTLQQWMDTLKPLFATRVEV